MNRLLPWIAALVTLVLHLLGNPHYGFVRDELYFIICGFHPQFGYVDQPPVVPLLSALTQLGGHSLFLLRAVPALCAAGGAYATARLVREFGGGVFGQVLATIAYLGAPVLVAFGMKVSTDEIGLWLWPLIALWLVLIVRGANPRLWLAIGASAGIAAESKYSVLFFVVALFAGLVCTPQRRILRSWWALAGTLLAIGIVVPNAVWQAVHGFPMWELLEAGQHGKNVIVGPIVYAVQELAITNFYLAPIWLVGVVWLIRTPPWRFLGYAYLVLIFEMLVLHGKHYYPADVYPIVIAAGAAALDGWIWRRALVRGTILAYATVFALVVLPLELPIIGVTQLVTYEQTVLRALYPISTKMLATEHNAAPPIGPDFADMHGWPEFAHAAEDAYDSLPAPMRAHAVILATNYGDASALAFFAPKLPVISTHNQYWLWGYHRASGDPMLELGGSCWHDDGFYAHRTVVAHYATSLPVMGYENNLDFLLCRGLRVPMSRLWSESKNYN
jgi:4-amino-4-deoxy-L-arabinose transferase-like glycosyltransferase